jgi:hypothetical protein
MELIGKKVSRNLDFSGKSEVSVNAVNGRVSLSHAAMRKTQLGKSRGNTIGFGYDKETGRCFLYVDESGVKMNDSGAMTSRFHSRELKNFFNIEDSQFKLNLDTIPQSLENFDGIDFFEISPVVDKTLQDALETSLDQSISNQ